MAGTPVTIGLSAVVMALADGEAAVLTVQPAGGGPEALPAGAFDPDAHRTFELGLRDFVAAQTGLSMGFVEQLYTFGDKGRDAPQASLKPGVRGVSVGYLALSPRAAPPALAGAQWRPWTDCFPYEDWRRGRPELLDQVIRPALDPWIGRDPARRSRADALFALSPTARWRDDQVLQRYELLYEAGLTAEAARDRDQPVHPAAAAFGRAMVSDHRRILATGLGRLRGKLRYRPVVFDLMPETFTLSQLQRTVEAITGLTMHKQNFRRGVERAALLERTGRIETATGGRPAELFRRRPASADDPQALGLSLPVLR